MRRHQPDYGRIRRLEIELGMREPDVEDIPVGPGTVWNVCRDPYGGVPCDNCGHSAPCLYDVRAAQAQPSSAPPDETEEAA